MRSRCCSLHAVSRGKFNGAVGNYNAHIVAFPDIDWSGCGTILGLEETEATATALELYIRNYICKYIVYLPKFSLTFHEKANGWIDGGIDGFIYVCLPTWMDE